jgi:alpha-beta hydrolase superfamily lysophospholipase
MNNEELRQKINDIQQIAFKVEETTEGMRTDILAQNQQLQVAETPGETAALDQTKADDRETIQRLKETMMYMQGANTELDKKLMEISPDLYEEAQDELKDLETKSQRDLGKFAGKKAKAEKRSAQTKLRDIYQKREETAFFAQNTTKTKRRIYQPADKHKPETATHKYRGALLNSLCLGPRDERRKAYDPHDVQADILLIRNELLTLPPPQVVTIADARARKSALQTEIRSLRKQMETATEEEKAVLRVSINRLSSQFSICHHFEMSEDTMDTQFGHSVIEDLNIDVGNQLLKGHIYRPAPGEQVLTPPKYVIFYSGTHSSNASQISSVAAQYNKMGATVIGVDYRGFGQSMTRGHGTNLSEATVYKDARTIYDHVLSAPTLANGNASNIILHGFSLGGAAAARLAADLADEKNVQLGKGEKVTENDRLGGLVLHSPIDSTKKVGNRMLFSGAGSVAGFNIGAYDTQASLRRLARHDTYIPLHLRGGGEGDQLSLPVTKMDEFIEGLGFKNFDKKNGEGAHQTNETNAGNFTSDFGNITQMVEHGRTGFGE